MEREYIPTDTIDSYMNYTIIRTELKLWREDETGAADFLHAYWMGQYYGFIGKND